jgi:hypothetical protein
MSKLGVGFAKLDKAGRISDSECMSDESAFKLLYDSGPVKYKFC